MPANPAHGIGIVAAVLITSLTNAGAQATPPVRPLGPILRVSMDPLASVATAIPASEGRVFVNDIVARRVLLFDSTLSKAIVVADSAGATANAYGPRPADLLAFTGDSALLITPASISMQVLSPQGQISRVIALPPRTLPASPAFDRDRRILFRTSVPQVRQPAAASANRIDFEQADSAFIARFDLVTRTFDTVAAFRIAKGRAATFRNAEGQVTSVERTAFPLPVVDDWTIASDGSLAIVRGRDYHIDWLGPDGTWSASPKIPFEWERLSDDRKVAIIDSTMRVREMQRDSSVAQYLANQAAAGRPTPTPTLVVSSYPLVGRPALTDMPDYHPPFFLGAMRGDAEGNVWIRTTKMVNGHPVYDVVNRQGALVDRVQLPPYRTIAGFGAGMIYMAVLDSTRVVHLERARIQR